MFKRIIKYLGRHWHQIKRWGRVLYRPLLLGLVIGLLVSNIIQQHNTQKAASAAEAASKEANNTTNQLKEFTTAVGLAVDDIKKNNDRGIDLLVCVLAIHGEVNAVTEADEEECRLLVYEAENRSHSQPQSSPTPSPSQAPSTSPGNSNGNGNSENTPPADNDGIILDLGIIPRIHIPSPF